MKTQGYIPDGPAIGVRFLTENRLIKQIELEPNTKLGLSWEIDGADKNLAQMVEQWLRAYVQKKDPEASLPLDWQDLHSFTRNVLKEVEKISLGSTKSYKELAEGLAKPKASRAVGGACGRNPFPLVIPCHRVIGSSGKMCGYSAANGIDTKKLLLDFETLR